MHVGLPCMKLSLSPSNQKHHGKAARTCSAKDAWAEMNDERRGRDTTIDRSMTYHNVWLTGNTEMDMTAEIQKQIDRVNEDKRVHGKRALRFDAVTGIEMIEKPPMEYMEKLSREEQIRFLKDSGAVMDSILKEWNPEWITAAQVLHFDEFGGRAPHSHRIVIPVTKDKDNILSFNAKAEFNLKFFTFVNKEYPKRMRERGYEVEDCKIYEEMTEEQKLEHQKDKPDYGLESMDFKRKKSEELDQRISEKESMLADKQQELEGLTKDQQAVKTENRKLKEENREIKAEILSKKQLEAMPMPPKTLKGDFKVSPDQYQAGGHGSGQRESHIQEGDKAPGRAHQTRRGTEAPDQRADGAFQTEGIEERCGEGDEDSSGGMDQACTVRSTCGAGCHGSGAE